ncbi:MAG: sulfatase-like hydrolase/transferase, partial [bacterium]|nr:sulfatase-like hydrolase/transferase [bacterium]
VIDTLEQVGARENTLVIYIAGDNGASLEGNLQGSANLMAQVNGVPETTTDLLRQLDDLGGPETTPFYPAGWAWAGNTPFQWGKRIASHLGGSRDPLVISWPQRIKDAGGIRPQFHHVIDLYPTILEAAGIPTPVSVNGVAQQPGEGISLAYTFDHPAAADRRTTQYFELLGNRAIYHDGWMATVRSGLLPWAYTQIVDFDGQPWELYDLTKDYSETFNLAALHPDRLAALQTLFKSEAEKHHVFPLNFLVAGRQHSNSTPPAGRACYTYYAGPGRLYDALAPHTENRSHTITAYVTIPTAGADGVLLAHGGSACGYALFLKNSRPTYTYNFFRNEVTTVTAPDPLPPGPASIQVHFIYSGGGLGKGATVELSINGRKVAAGWLPRTVPVAFSFEETMDIGEDSASPVGDYRSPFKFTGGLDRVELAYDAPLLAPADQKRLEAARAKAEAIKQ